MKSFLQKTHITQQHGITEREYCAYLTFSFSLFTSFNRQEVMFVCDSKDSFRYLRDTNETIYASRWRVFIKKTQITEQHGITGAYCVYLTFSFSLFTSFNRQEVMFAIRKIAFVIFATPTKQFMLADKEFSSKKLKELSSMELQNVSFAFISRFHFHYSHHSTDGKWCLFAIQKITKANLATPTKQFLLADEEFSSKKLKELSYMELQNVSFAFIPRFHFQYSHHSTDGKWCLFAIQKITKAIFATPTKQFLLADEEFLSKKPK